MRIALTVLALVCASWSVAAAQEREDRALVRSTGLRLRMGGDLGIGGAGGNDARAGSSIPAAMAFSGHIRAGAQFDDDWAVLYQAGLEIGAPWEMSFGWGSGSSGLGAISQVVHTSSILGELTLGHMFQAAIGPTFAIGHVARQIGDSLFVGGGFTARVGIALGGRGIGTRQGLSIATQLDLLFTPDGRMLAIIGQTFGWDTF